MAIARFEKVSFDQFRMDMEKLGYGLESIQKAYEKIVLPKRSTTGSAGYDFVSPVDFTLSSKSQIIPTGIRAKINQDYVLVLFPRSSIGFKYGGQLDNTAGIIDSDYYDSQNEGHILVKIHSQKTAEIHAGDRFVQGLFLAYGLAEEEEVETKRQGGIGSTNQ